MIQFEIDQWQAWAPGLASTDDWANWAGDPCELESSDAQPDVSFLPAMQRRRLSRLARMVFAVATPLAANRAPMPLVYASRHGETTRTFAILNDLASDEPLSPTQFSLSVHNAIIGLWSIQQQDTSEMTVLAAEGDGYCVDLRFWSRTKCIGHIVSRAPGGQSPAGRSIALRVIYLPNDVPRGVMGACNTPD